MKTYWETFQKISPILVLALLFLLFKTCETANREKDNYDHNLKTLNEEQKEITLKNGALATEKTLLIGTNKQLRKQLLIKDDTIAAMLKRKPVVVVKWKTITKFDTVFMPFAEPIPFDFYRNFNNKNKWYSISGTVNQNGVILNPPLIPNQARLVVDYTRGKPTVTIVNSNPFIVTEQTEGIIIDVPRKRWVIAGGVGWNIIQDPYIGIFGGYKIFEF